jgi:hypothetical protein
MMTAPRLAPYAAAVAVAEADPRRVPHEEVRAWLLRLADGEFDAAAPKLR